MNSQVAETAPRQSEGQPQSMIASGRDMSSHPLQRHVDDSPRQSAQGKLLVQLKGESASPRANGLPSQLRAGIEALSGMDMGSVVLHRNSSKPAQLNAHAYAQGNEIHLGPGQEKHLPHEAWHVVQQGQGRVTPTRQLKGTRVNDNASLEKEADVMGLRALHTPANQSAGAAMATFATTGSIQRQAILPEDLTSEGIIQFLVQMIKEGDEVSSVDQERIFNFVAKLKISINRGFFATYRDLYHQARYAEGGLIYEDINKSKKIPTRQPRKKRKLNEEKTAPLENDFSDSDSDLSDGDLDIERLYGEHPKLYQQAVDHSDFNQVEGVINPRNTNMLVFQDGSLIPSSINGKPNTKATRKSKRKLAAKLGSADGGLRDRQQRLFFGSHLKQDSDGKFRNSMDTLKRSSRKHELGSAPVERLATQGYKGFSIVDTDSHAEQSLLHFHAWDAIKKRLIQQIKATTSPVDVPTVEDRNNAILLTLLLNRSSCRGCGLALSLALIGFWQQVGLAMEEGKLSWREVKDKYTHRVRFVIRFPTIYEFAKERGIDLANIKDVLAGMIDAGWEVAPVKPGIEGGIGSYDKLVEILKESGAYPEDEDFKYFRAGGAPRKSIGKPGEGVDKSVGVQPLPPQQPIASGQRVEQDALGAYLTTIAPDWNRPFPNVAQGGINGGAADAGIFAHQAIANDPRDFLPPQIQPVEEAELMNGHRLIVHRNDGSGALCFIYSILMGLTGQSQGEVTPMVHYIALRTHATEGWINADSALAVAVITEIERIYGTQIDLAVVQQGVAPIISARGGHAGGRVVIIRQTDNHYDAYIPQ